MALCHHGRTCERPSLERPHPTTPTTPELSDASVLGCGRGSAWDAVSRGGDSLSLERERVQLVYSQHSCSTAHSMYSSRRRYPFILGKDEQVFSTFVLLPYLDLYKDSYNSNYCYIIAFRNKWYWQNKH
jgi:hypothetical protein